mgnify:FL=1
MVKHIVLWTLHAHAKGNTQQQNAQLAKAKLESLKEIIPQVIDIEVGINLAGEGSSVDICLYSTFKDETDLKAYQAHPEHQKVLPFMSAIKAERHVIDYSI